MMMTVKSPPLLDTKLGFPNMTSYDEAAATAPTHRHDCANHSKKENLKMVSSSFYFPKDDESKPRGEDAHFISDETQTFGVADGVGGWAKRGVDAGEYARQLMKNCVAALHLERKGAVDPKRVLNSAFSNTKAQGSSTACVVTVNGGVLHAANVGDSGFMLFRDNKCLFKSPVQQSCFNCPYQLGNSKHSDRPDVAHVMMVEVKAGDIIVAGSDGLLDNMYPAEIEDVLKQGTTNDQEGSWSGHIALNIAELALYNSFDKFAYSPFARAAKRAGKKHMGGKIDDITVIVGLIESSKE